MTRQQRPNDVVNDIARRFILAVDEYLGFTPTELSRRLGYANPSTLQAVKKRTTLPDFARLAEHKEALKNDKGQVLNLHWVITGDGSPLLRAAGKPSGVNGRIDDDIMIKLKKLPEKKRSALVNFLAEFE